MAVPWTVFRANTCRANGCGRKFVEPLGFRVLGFWGMGMNITAQGRARREDLILIIIMILLLLLIIIIMMIIIVIIGRDLAAARAPPKKPQKLACLRAGKNIYIYMYIFIYIYIHI